MGFREDHPKAVRVHARLWLALIAAVLALAAIGTASLAATDGVSVDCPQALADAHPGQPPSEECEQLGAGEAVAPPAEPAAAEPQPEPAPEDPTPQSSDDAPGQPAMDPGTAGEHTETHQGAEPAQAAEPAQPGEQPAPPGEQPAQPTEQPPGAPMSPAPETSDAAPGAATTGENAGADDSNGARKRHATSSRQEVRPRRAPVERKHTAKRLRGPAARPAQTSFPPVSIDWLSLTPLAPPAFGSGEATRFPGPLFLLPIYQAAAVQYRVPWEVLAAINEIETGFGSNLGPSSAGAMGWMQFMPATWATFGVDANRDGQKNPNDPVDAIFAAARYLRASGAHTHLPRAIFAYNHADWYVARVLARAKAIGDLPEDLLATLVAEGRTQATAIRRATGSPGLLDPDHEPKTIGRVLLLDDERLREHVLEDERIEIYGCGREDIAAAIVDRRVLETLAFLASRKLHPAVTSLRCGHGYYTAGGSVSEHSHGSAVDIARVNGTPILGHQGEGSVTDATVRALLELRGGLRPHQIISLMTFTGASNALALSDHDDHVHVGFAPLRNLEESR